MASVFSRWSSLADQVLGKIVDLDRGFRLSGLIKELGKLANDMVDEAKGTPLEGSRELLEAVHEVRQIFAELHHHGPSPGEEDVFDQIG